MSSAHVVIAGTGRAGTSFLVRFLEACGLDTGASHGEWFSRARAGLEHRVSSEAAPYVLKDPWLFSYTEDIDLTHVRIDALILPVRELMAAAESRLLQERLRIADSAPERADVQVVGQTPGGVLYSLDVVDQARVLAVGFHKVLYWAVAHDIQVLLPAFPRMVEDCDYLIDSLWPWLGAHVSRPRAHEAFADIAAASNVRVRVPSRQPTPPQPLILDRGEPDRTALALAACTERLEELSDEHSQSIGVLESAREEIECLKGLQRQSDSRIAAAEEEVARRDEVLAKATERSDHLFIELQEAEAQLESVRTQLAQVHETAAWRVRERLIRHRRLHAAVGRVAHIAAKRS